MAREDFDANEQASKQASAAFACPRVAREDLDACTQASHASHPSTPCASRDMRRQPSICPFALCTRTRAIPTSIGMVVVRFLLPPLLRPLHSSIHSSGCHCFNLLCSSRSYSSCLLLALVLPPLSHTKQGPTGAAPLTNHRPAPRPSFRV